MSTTTQKKLHNFTFPFLNWGQKHHTTTTTNTSRRHRHRHRTDANVINRSKPNSAANLVDVEVAAAAEGDVKPWKLRPRKSVNGNGNGNGRVNGNGNGNEEVNGNGGKSGRLMRGVVVPEEVVVEEEKDDKRKRRLWISLSKDEIEEDVYAFTGAKPNRRPKKRNKIAQKHVDNVFPGLYLCGMSADSYRV